MGSQSISPDPESDARRVLDALRRIVRALHLAQNPAGPGELPSAAQLFVLHALKGTDGLSVGELAGRTATDPSSVSVVVRKLHAKGLVGKRTSGQDRRRLDVTLTPAGAELLARAPIPVQEQLLARMAAMTPGQLGALAGLLERLAPVEPGAPPAPMFFQESEL